jgi:hypothetical protein
MAWKEEFLAVIGNVGETEIAGWRRKDISW